MVVVARNWWAVMVRGFVGIAFGLFALFRPAAAFAALLAIFGVYAFTDGIFNVVVAVRDARGERGWWVLLLSGLAGMLAGVATFLAPALTALVVLYIIAGWAVVTGALEVAAAVRLRRHITGEWLMALNGALSLVFGVLIMVAPLAGALAVVWLIGAYALVSGLVLLALGLRLRRAVHGGPPEGALRRAA
jgi:uncharacterized membrane protein HdeD (DUF308 family)